MSKGLPKIKSPYSLEIEEPQPFQVSPEPQPRYEEDHLYFQPDEAPSRPQLTAEDMSLLSSDATLIFNPPPASHQPDSVADDRMVAAVQRSGQVSYLVSGNTTLIADDDSMMTSSVYDDGLSLFTPMVHDPNNLATPSMNQLTLNRCSSEFGTSAADAAVSKERASKARHEQRRSNLRRKRLKEQMMQVCEGFVREQIAIVTVQAFVEANFLNDMMNFQHEVINSAVEMELRRVIRGVLEEIYFAHIATLFLENMMAEELREVALGQVALMKKKRLLDETGVIQSGIAYEIIEGTIYEEVVHTIEESIEEVAVDKAFVMLSKRVNTSLLDSATNFCLQEASILEGIWAEYLKHQLLDTSIEALIHLSKPEDHLISRQLDTIILSQDILGSLINPMTALVVLNTVEDELIANEIRENLTEDIIRQESQEFTADIIVENILLPKIVSTIYSGTVLIEKKSFEERAGRKAMIVKGEIAEAYYQGMVYNEVIALIKNQMELEYFSRSILDPVLNRFICSEIKQAYYCEIIVKDLSSLLIKSQVRDLAQEVLSGQQKSRSLTHLSSHLTQQLLNDTLREASLDLIVEAQIEDKLPKFNKQALSNALDDALLLDIVFDSLLCNVVRREVTFQLRLERDSHVICQQIFDESLHRNTGGSVLRAVVPIQVQSQVIEQSLVKEIVNINGNAASLFRERDDLLDQIVQVMMKEIAVEAEDELAAPFMTENSAIREEEPALQRDKNDLFAIGYPPEGETNTEHDCDKISSQPPQPVPKSPVQTLMGEIPTSSIIRQRSNLVINLAEVSFKPFPISHSSGPTKSAKTLIQEDAAVHEYLNSFLREGILRFISDIVYSIVLPHKIYKRVMNRMVRKTTYLAIQQAVDIAYRTEEDAINLADQMLDRFVEDQLREMVMLYPNNQQRRSHTILIDQSVEKFKKPAPTTTISQDEQHRTRNALATNNQRTGQPQSQKLMFISEEDLLIASDAASHAKKKSHQRHPNQRYYEAQQQPTMNQDSFTSNPAAFEETKGKHVPYSSQKSATYYTPLPAIPQEKDLAATGVFGGLVNLTLHMGTHYQTTQQQRLGTDGGFGAPLVTLSQEHITDTEGLPLEDDHLQYQLVKKQMASNKEAHAYHAKKKRSIELMNNISDESSPEEIIDDDISQQQQYMRMNVYSDGSDQGSSQIPSQKSIKTRQPKEGIRFVESNHSTHGTLNTLANFPQRHYQLNLELGPQQLNTFDNKGAPNPTSPHQFDKFQTAPKAQRQQQYGRPNPQLAGSASKSGGVDQKFFAGTKSPQHGRYFDPNDQKREVAFFSNKEKRKETPHRTNSKTRNVGPTVIKNPSKVANNGNKKTLFDLRGAQPQIQTTIKKPMQYNFPPEGQYQSAGHPLTEAKSPVGSVMAMQSRAQLITQHFPKSLSSKSVAQPSTVAPQEAQINGDIQKMMVTLKSRIVECKYRAAQKGGGPSTSLLMTQYASEVLSSLADQIVNVKQPSLSTLLDRTDLDPRLAADLGLEEYSIPDLDAVASNAQRRDALFSIDRKIKELVAKLQQNQSLMNKHDYQLCILQANQLSMLNYQKLTLLMQQSEGALLQGSDTEDEYESLGSAGARSMLEVQGGFLGGRHLLPQTRLVKQGKAMTQIGTKSVLPKR